MIGVCLYSLLLQFSLKLQDEVNTKSLKILEEYVVRYEMLMQELKSKLMMTEPHTRQISGNISIPSVNMLSVQNG